MLDLCLISTSPWNREILMGSSASVSITTRERGLVYKVGRLSGSSVGVAVFQSQGHAAKQMQTPVSLVMQTCAPAVTGAHEAAPPERLRDSTGVLACLLPRGQLGLGYRLCS